MQVEPNLDVVVRFLKYAITKIEQQNPTLAQSLHEYYFSESPQTMTQVFKNQHSAVKPVLLAWFKEWLNDSL